LRDGIAECQVRFQNCKTRNLFPKSPNFAKPNSALSGPDWARRVTKVPKQRKPKSWQDFTQVSAQTANQHGKTTDEVRGSTSECHRSSKRLKVGTSGQANKQEAKGASAEI